jgi:protein SCO1/2
MVCAAVLTAANHRIEGLVVEVEPLQGIVVIAHGPINNSMPAMTMPFRVSRAGQLDGLAPGMRVSFQLDAAGSRISDVHIVRADFGDRIRIPEPSNKLRIGDAVPDFELVDQDARPVRLSDSRGSTTVVNFIYTRCPMPDVCPRLSANFAYLARKVPGVRLLTITLDPSHDTPEVLRAYATRFNAPLEHWRFLTAPESLNCVRLADSETQSSCASDLVIREIGGLFGLVYWPEEGVITHTSSTAVIGSDGRLRALIEGTSFRADELLALVERVSR